MSRSCVVPLSIPCAAKLANPNRAPLWRRRASKSVACFGAGNKTTLHDSVTCASASTTTSPGKMYSSSISAIPSISHLLNRPSPEIGLVSVLFVLSTVFGAFLSLGLISIPAIAAFRSLGISASKLEKVAAQEATGTLLSLKLSGMEISGVTQLISRIRWVISNASGSRSNYDNQKRRV